MSYLRGKRCYNGEKQAQGGDHGNQHTVAKGQNVLLAKADRLATEYNVNEKTIKRDGQFAAAVDTLAQAGIEPPFS